MAEGIIDIHCHYRKADGYLDEMLAASAEAGVQWLCLSGGGERWRQHDNDGVMAAAQAHPDRIIPFAFIHLGEDSAADVRAWHEAGFRGLKTQYPTDMYDSEAFFPVYEAAEELSLPILFHVGISARFVPDHDRWNTSSRFMMPLTLDRIARCFPNLTIWGAHLGYPESFHAAAMMSVHPRVFFDICGLPARSPVLLPWDELLRTEAQWGKLVYRTEGGPRGFAPLAAHYREPMTQAGVSAAVQQRVMRGNAAEALGL
ncbi:MAG: amidohydrolase family protein [Armatimonadota bacterium]